MSRRIALTAAAVTLSVSAGAAVMPPAHAAATVPAENQAVPFSKNLKWSEYPTADWQTRDSRWQGFKLRHPSGGKFYPEVTRWANLVLAVMGEHRVPAKFLPGILAQIQQESSGNPYAVNRWDSNAAAGHPSKGLLQVIAPTYRAYAKPGYTSIRFQTVPYTNIWASLNYVKDRYGMRKFTLWNKGHNQGYYLR